MAELAYKLLMVFIHCLLKMQPVKWIRAFMILFGNMPNKALPNYLAYGIQKK